VSVPRFWREIPQRYNLEASKCGACQAIHYPPREVCPTCRRASVGRMQAVKLAGTGTVLECTVVHKAAPGYTMQVPYCMALIQSTEGPIIAGQVVDCDPHAVHAGAAVRAVFRRLGQDGDDGVIYYGTKWRLQAVEATAPQPETQAPKRGRSLRRKDKGKDKKDKNDK
jgi:uncharacterized OB-fold protein